MAEKTNPEVDGYQGSFSPTWAKGRDASINPINQYFTNEDLYQPANTYNADLPYADFMPYYSAKGTEFDANINQDSYNMGRLGMILGEDNTFQNEKKMLLETGAKKIKQINLNIQIMKFQSLMVCQIKNLIC